MGEFIEKLKKNRTLIIFIVIVVFVIALSLMPWFISVNQKNQDDKKTTMVNATAVSVPLVSAQQNFVGGRARNGNDYTSIMSNGRLMMNQSVPSTPY